MGKHTSGRHAATTTPVRRGLWRAARLFTPLALFVAVAEVGQSAYATFTSTKNVTSNAFTAGTVSLTDNEASAAMFSASGLAPSSAGSACIQVKYTGSGPVSVKLYVPASGLTGSLGTYLQLKIEQGTGTALNCSDFVSSSTIYNAATSSSNTLAAFAASSTDFSTGVGSWAPSVANQTMSYRISYVVLRNSSASGTTATVSFTWEADST
jgi:hypothetical protein